jgi:surface antigen
MIVICQAIQSVPCLFQNAVMAIVGNNAVMPVLLRSSCDFSDTPKFNINTNEGECFMPYPSHALKRVSVKLTVQLIAGCVVLASGAAHAANLGFLNNTPITYMKQRDLQALNNAAHSALDTKQDGESLDWNNEGAGNPVAINGTITPSDTKKDGDRTCRKLTMVAHAKGQTQTWAPAVCKTDGGKWALLKQ